MHQELERPLVVGKEKWAGKKEKGLPDRMGSQVNCILSVCSISCLSFGSASTSGDGGGGCFF